MPTKATLSLTHTCPSAAEITALHGTGVAFANPWASGPQCRLTQGSRETPRNHGAQVQPATAIGSHTGQDPGSTAARVVLPAGLAVPNPASIALHELLGYELISIVREVGRKFEHWIDTR